MLKVDGLVKKYGKFLAVDHLNMEIENGQIYGFVGPNGAGKTTTMRIIATLLPATAGKVEVGGIDAFRQPLEVRGHIGYMPDFFGVYDNLKVMEYLDFYGNLYHIPYDKRMKTANELLELVELENKRESYVDELSRGMKQRLCLARSLIHDPDLLILDEPASGMDPRARIEMKRILHKLKDLGKTILISSHILPELAEICDIVGIIEGGRMVAEGSVDDIMSKISGSTIINIRMMRDADKAIKILKEHPLVSGVTREGNELEVSYIGKDDEIWQVIKALIDNRLPILSFGAAGGNLEKIFMEVTKGEEFTK